MTELTAIELRQTEVKQYEANIVMFTAIASTLPSVWPEHLIEFKGSKDKHSDIAKVDDLADVELLADLWAYDDAQAAIRTETVEKRKSQAILTVLESQAPTI